MSRSAVPSSGPYRLAGHVARTGCSYARPDAGRDQALRARPRRFRRVAAPPRSAGQEGVRHPAVPAGSRQACPFAASFRDDDLVVPRQTFRDGCRGVGLAPAVQAPRRHVGRFQDGLRNACVHGVAWCVAGARRALPDEEEDEDNDEDQAAALPERCILLSRGRGRRTRRCTVRSRWPTPGRPVDPDRLSQSLSPPGPRFPRRSRR